LGRTTIQQITPAVDDDGEYIAVRVTGLVTLGDASGDKPRSPDAGSLILSLEEALRFSGELTQAIHTLTDGGAW
jgi:hypothetical protein